MKKVKLAAVAAAVCILAAGCSDSGDNGKTERIILEGSVQTAAKSSAAYSEEDNVPETSETAAAETIAEKRVSSYDPDELDETWEIPETKSAVELISAYDNDYLGLPLEDRVYIFADSGKTAQINGETCSSVSCYDEDENTLYYLCEFYISEDGGSVYRYYESEERYALLPEGSFERLDPTKQSPDDIFAAANELYLLFDENALNVECDKTTIVEINGAEYYPVTDERFDTKAELLEALDKYFSEEIINSLMSGGKFTEMGGKMYVKAVSDGIPLGTNVTYELTSLTDDEAVFMRYDTYVYEAGETETKGTEYIAEKADGIWRFTKYTAPGIWH